MTAPHAASTRYASAGAALAPDVTQRAAIDPDTAWFLDFLFGEQEGQLCLGYVDGDPSIPKGQPGYSPLKEEWYRWPRQRSDILARLAQLDGRHINTYVRQCLFSKESGTQANALPSRIVWQDDVTDPYKPCSVLIQTSDRKYQAILRLDRDATTAERKRLATQWHMSSTDTEDTQHASYDPVHHIRVAGGHNSKGHGWHRVTYAQRSERTYNADKLLARCGGDTLPPDGAVSAARAEQHDAGDWEHLLDGRRLLDSPRYEAIINGRPQLRRILIEHGRVTITNKNGETDESDSAQVAVVVQNLITSWSDKSPGHLPESEIRAAMLTLKPMLRPGISLYQYKVDVDVLINKKRPKDYQPVATRRLGAKRKRGRPAGQIGAQTIATLRAIEAIEPDAFGRRILHLDALAEHRRTAQYRIAVLRKAGLLITKQLDGNGLLYALLTPKGETHGAQESHEARAARSDLHASRGATVEPGACPSQRGHADRGATRRSGASEVPHDRPETLGAAGRVESQDAGGSGADARGRMGDCGASGSDPAAGAQVNYAAAEAPITAAAASETPIADALHGETEYKKASVYPPDRASELAPLLPPLADLAAHYLDTSASEIGERLVNEQNGTVIYRRTARHFAALALEHYGDAYSHADALTAYASERARRDELARQEWSRFFMRLKAMSDGELIAYIAGRCQAEVAELSREGTVFDKHLYRTRLKCARQHLEWRGLKMPDPNPGRRKPIPRKLRPVDMAPAPCVKQAGLFEVAADTGKPNISEPPAASGAERRAKPPGWSVKAR